MSLCQDLNQKIQNIKTQLSKLEEFRGAISNCVNSEELEALKTRMQEVKEINDEFSKYKEVLEGLKYNFKEECLKMWGLEVNDKNLKNIDLNENGYIEKIDFGNRGIRKVPEEIGSLTNLIKLYLYGNQLKELPEEIGSLTNLTLLHLDRNQIKELPKEIGNLRNLTTLYLGNNQLEKLPEEIENLTNLIKLYLYGNQLRELPEEIGNLTNLTELYLYGNQICTDNEKIKKLRKLLPKTIIEVW